MDPYGRWGYYQQGQQGRWQQQQQWRRAICRPRNPNPDSINSKADAITRAQVAASKAYAAALDAGESVTLSKLTRSVFTALNINSFEALGFRLQQVPCLNTFMLLEGKINAFIHCYVATMRISTLYDLNKDICKNEGVEKFEELRLGPLIKHPLVLHYFATGTATSLTIHKISTQQVVLHLSGFLDGKEDNRDIQLDEFLSYLCKKESVLSPSELCVRVQNLRMYVGFLRRIKKSEEEKLRHIKSEVEKTMSVKRKREESSIHARIVSERLRHSIQSGSEITDSLIRQAAAFGPKHTRFISDSDDDDDQERMSGEEIKNETLQTSCPYPSAAEEMKRLGKRQPKDESGTVQDKDDDNVERGKRRKTIEHDERPDFPPNVTEDEEQIKLVEELFRMSFLNPLLSGSELKVFVSAWKTLCCKTSAQEILKKMIEFQGPYFTVRKMNNLKFASSTNRWLKLFTTWPAIGLINVAVMSIKMGMWEAFIDKHAGASLIYETAKFQNSTSAVNESINVEPENGSSMDEILEHIITFFQQEQGKHSEVSETVVDQWFRELKLVRNCERWVIEKLAVREFSCLGYGDFLEFFRQQFSKFSEKLTGNLIFLNHSASSIKAHISVDQVLELISQATETSDCEVFLTRENIDTLLYMQFPCIKFVLSESNTFEQTAKKVKEQFYDSSRKHVRYSGALLAKTGMSNPYRWKLSASILPETESGNERISFGQINGINALHCLLKAPMLSDLEEWSHWDWVFASTLGSLLSWLEKEGAKQNILVLVTRKGKIVRIDSTASVEKFLSAAAKGEALEVASQLVSIASLYGGIHNAPISLLKSHACHALQVLVKNSGSLENTGSECWIQTQHMVDYKKSQSANVDTDRKINKDSSSDKAFRISTRFILECLALTPPEFRSFVADILLSGLSSVYEKTHQILLHECVSCQDRIMLHDIGYSLGITDWINDCHDFLDSANASSLLQVQDFVSECRPPKKILEGVESLNSLAGGRKELSMTSNQKEDVKDLDSSLVIPSGLCNISQETFQCNISQETFRADTAKEMSNRALKDENGRRIVEAIRRDEFGLDIDFQWGKSDILKKQHSRLSRALQCLSQQLYSCDSHFLLELVQNADDNCYPENVYPTFALVVQKDGIVVLNNEVGFSAENIRALCDVGNSTKPSSVGGYIGHKGIGFKSVFRITDAPEIHSNGFHLKFDITEGELGFVLPTAVVPFSDFEMLSREVSDEKDASLWNTCIVLPFKNSFSGADLQSYTSKFSDLQPSLLLFLHRLRCIKIRNHMADSMAVMRREDIDNGIVKITYGNESIFWLVAKRKLNVGTLRPGIETTEIAIAFRLHVGSNGEYEPHLEQQPVHAFLPLRAYGLKFIIQADFTVPSSREEVDGDSAWNQWLLSEFPDLFVSSSLSFSGLSKYYNNPGKAVSLHMSFVPLVGEVLGFFSPLPSMILSKLRASPCMPLEGETIQWVLPSMALRGWNDNVRDIIPDSLLNKHLSLGYLQHDVYLSDALAASLGIQTYGPVTLIEVMKSICKNKDELKDLGFKWIGSWLALLSEGLKYKSSNAGNLVRENTESDILVDLSQIAFVPLSDGTYSCAKQGMIWLPCKSLGFGGEGYFILQKFPKLYSELRTVHPSLFLFSDGRIRDDSETIVSLLKLAGISELSSHEIVTKHILESLSDSCCLNKDKNTLVEYLAFILLHLQSNCSLCILEKEKMMKRLREKALIITNNGCKYAAAEPIHFSKDFNNPVDMSRVLQGTNVIWNEIDNIYLNFTIEEDKSRNLLHWRTFFSGLGVTDLMQVISIEKKIESQSSDIWKDISWDSNQSPSNWIVKDWESPELTFILQELSSSVFYVNGCSQLVIELDKIWDDMYGSIRAFYWPSYLSEQEGRCTSPSFVRQFRNYTWIRSRLDGRLHYPTELFYDCKEVRAIIGNNAPYADPQVKNRSLVLELGLKTTVDIKDVLILLSKWSKAGTFKSSISQMGRLYAFLWKRMDCCAGEIQFHFRNVPSIFVPLKKFKNKEKLVKGIFYPISLLFWKDPTGCTNALKKQRQAKDNKDIPSHICFQDLCELYPSLHSFFVTGCYVKEVPDFDIQLKMLQQLAVFYSPSEVQEQVMHIFYLWAESIDLKTLDSNEIARWKKCLCDPANCVIPTIQNKWVSLNPESGPLCFNDDDELVNKFKQQQEVYFLPVSFENVHSETKGQETNRRKLISFWKAMEIPSISEMVKREAIYQDIQEEKNVFQLVNWILPYAQRYMYKLHPELYIEVADTKFSKNSERLHVSRVQKLFYTLSLKTLKLSDRHECYCLLQEDSLFVSESADISAICLELSRLFFKGRVNLQLANFLHLVTVMLKSSSPEEDIESFVAKAQGIPKIPHGEQIWSCESREIENLAYKPSSGFDLKRYFSGKITEKSNTGWPPTSWIGVPKDNMLVDTILLESDENLSQTESLRENLPENCILEKPLNEDAEFAMIEQKGNSNYISNSQQGTAEVDCGSYQLAVALKKTTFAPPAGWNGQDMPDDERNKLTGRIGESLVYNYLSEKYGNELVTWVNKDEETGAAFDIILKKDNRHEQFIEVKATSTKRSNWFPITNREWEFANKVRERFTIIRVILNSSPYTKLSILEDPVKLYRQRIIKLAVLLPSEEQYSFPEISLSPQDKED